MSTDFLSTEMSPMKEENKTPAPPVIKKDLPEELHPGAPIEETSAAASAADEPTAGIGSEAPPTPEEKKVTERELAKVNAGAAIYGVALVLALILAFGPYIKFTGSLFGVFDNNMSVVGVFAAIAMLLFFPTFCSAIAARIARWFVGSTTPERLSPYFKAFFAINGLVIAFFVHGKTRLLFIIPEAISLVLTSAILTYNGGGFAKHCKKLLIHIFKK